MKKFVILFLISFRIFSQEFYEIKKKSDDKPLILKVKKLESNQITVITDNLMDVTIPMEDIESIKEYVPNAEKLYKKVVLFVDKTYVEGIIIQTNTKKIVIEIQNYPDLKIFRSKEIEDIVDPETFKYEKSKTKEKAGMYSFIFPGWGQHYGNQPSWKGYSITAGFLLSAILTANLYTSAQESYSTYQSSLNYDNGALRKHVTLSRYANYTALIGLGLWGYAVSDAYLFFRPKYEHTPHELMNRNIEVRAEIGVEKPYE